MIEFEKPNIKCLDMDNEKNYAKFVRISKKIYLKMLKEKICILKF